MASSARIDELRKKFDENPRRYFAPLANEYRKVGDLEQAIFICQEYLPQQPGHMSGHIVYGQALFEMGRMEPAQVVFETALSLDPENLIALRHLGDISRQTGDLNGARVWYQRVLEADPRNEEIAQIMLALLAGPESGMDARAPTPRTSPAVAYEPPHHEVIESPPPPPATAAATDASAAFTVEKSEDGALPTSHDAAPLVPSASPQPGQGTSAVDGHEFLDLNDFDLGGVAHGSVPSAEPEPADRVTHHEYRPWGDAAESGPIVEEEFFVETPITAPAEFSPPVDGPVADHTPDPDTFTEQTAASPGTEASSGFNLGQEDGPFELDPFAIAGGSVPARIELATDINLGLPDDGTSADMTAVDSPVIEGLESFEAGVIADLPEESTPVGAADFFAADSSSEDPAPAAPPPAFVTETMAELYLEQGHVESALGIYTQLVEQRPGDARLRERLEAVVQRVYGGTPMASTVEPDAAAAPVYGGPTIREFLIGLTSRRASPVAELPDERVAPPVSIVDGDEAASYDALGEVSSAPDRAPASEPASEPASDLGNVGFGSAVASPSRRTPSSSETVSGSIDALFSGTDESNRDVESASALQDAFASDPADATPLQGMPARRASSELSLDHVFKGSTPPPADTDGFSFDQFFAEEMADSGPSASGEGGAPAGETTDDIAQFNAWLNGLKKT